MKKIKYTLLSVLLCASANTWAKTVEFIEVTSKEKQLVEVVFVLDTTGSMASLIDGAKKKIWSIANTIVDINPNAEVRMALIAYRDRGDDYTVKTVHDLNSDVQGLYSSLTKLQADGGGDTPESVNEALNKGVNGLQWSADANAKRILFLVGDAPPHMDYVDEKQYDAIIEEAVSKHVLVNAVQAGDSPSTKTIWKKIAKQGRGSYLPIPQNGGQFIQVKTPYDEKILSKQEALNKTIIVYGNDEVQNKVKLKMSVRGAASVQTQVDNASFYAKKSYRKKVISGSGDLVADVNNDEIDISALKDAELPALLQNKSVKERKAIVQEKSKARKVIETEITILVKKRDKYIKNNKPQKADSFDSVVEKALIKQLKAE